MRVIISNDKQRLYAKIDYGLLDKTKTSTALTAAATTITVLNATGFAQNDYVLIGNWFDEQSEIRKVSSVTGQILTLSAAVTYAHDNKTNIWKLQYNQIKFYETDTVLATVDIRPDYYTSYAYTISDDTKQYSIAFYNESTTKISPRGEKVYGYEHLLCSSGDLFAFESLDMAGHKLLDKMDIATNEILAQYIVQDQDYDDLSYRDYLRIPAALLSLSYAFAELTKNPDDTAAEKKKYYRELYDVKIREANEKITMKEKDDDGIQIFGQTRCDR